MLSLGQAKIGQMIVWRGQIWEIAQVNHQKMGRGQAKLVTKLRNLLTGALVDQTFSGNDQIEEAITTYQNGQFLYREGQTCHFMTSDTFEQLSFPLPAQKAEFLKEGEQITATIWEGKVVAVKIPTKVELKVTYAEPAIKGNTANNPCKTVTLETGAKVQVPLFIEQGDIVRINSDTGQYDSRV